MTQHLRSLLYLGVVFAAASCNNGSPRSQDGASQPTEGAAPGSKGLPNGSTGTSPNDLVTAPGIPLTPTTPLPFVGTLGGPANGYTLVGRFDTSTPAAPRFSLPNSRIGATFTGDSLAIVVSGDGTNVLGVQIDNQPAVAITTSPSAMPTPYPVATGLGAGPHVAWLTKRTEAREQSQIDPNQYTSPLTFYGFALAANATLGTPPNPRPRLIITIGDSGFTGYGAAQLETAETSCVYSPATQNAEASVPAKLADLLSAEVINVSASGKGIAASAYDPNNTNNQLPALWNMTVPNNRLPAYTFPSLPVDAIILDGGSNDLIGAYGVGTFGDTNVFITKYTALLADMRSHYPSALIVGIINPNAIDSDKTLLTQAIGAAVAARNAAGDSKVYAYDYFTADPNGWKTFNDAANALQLGHGCQGHPAEAGASFLAGRLATFLRSKAGA